MRRDGSNAEPAKHAEPVQVSAISAVSALKRLRGLRLNRLRGLGSLPIQFARETHPREGGRVRRGRIKRRAREARRASTSLCDLGGGLACTSPRRPRLRLPFSLLSPP